MKIIQIAALLSALFLFTFCGQEKPHKVLDEGFDKLKWGMTYSECKQQYPSIVYVGEDPHQPMIEICHVSNFLFMNEQSTLILKLNDGFLIEAMISILISTDWNTKMNMFQALKSAYVRTPQSKMVTNTNFGEQALVLQTPQSEISLIPEGQKSASRILIRHVRK